MVYLHAFIAVPLPSVTIEWEAVWALDTI